MKYYKFLDLPQIPDHLDLNPGEMMREFKSMEYIKDGKISMTSDVVAYQATTELQTWIKDNIIPEYKDVSIRFQYGGDGRTTTVLHTDKTRKFVLQYNLQHADGILTYWKEEGQPELRPEVEIRESGYDYSKLTKLDEVFIPNKQWVLIHTKVLHSVENLTGNRINVQISLDYDPFDNQ